MGKSSRRLRIYVGALLASALVVVAAVFLVNCLVDPLWYFRGNILTEINYPFNERLAKLNRFLPRMKDYDCLILGTSRATLLPEEKIEGYHCFNMAFSDGQGSEYLAYAKYLRQRGYSPKLLIVDVKREEFVGPTKPGEVPDFISNGEPAPSIFATYLSLDALDFSIRTLRKDPPHHRYYDKDFAAELEVRSKRHRFNPAVPIKASPPPNDVHPERAQIYVELRQQFPMAKAIAYVPPVSAWSVAAFSLTDGLDEYLEAIDRVAAAYDRFLNFSVPSPITAGKEGTYDGSHYSRAVNAKVAAALLANKSDLWLEWRKGEEPSVVADYRARVAQFLASANQTAAEAKPHETKTE